MTNEEPLIPKHGGYRNLKSFQIAELIYDVTVRFCDRYIDPRSRTHDQMVQAARSGSRNIAEGSQAAGTSKKTELKLTNVGRASLEELRLDYESFLRQRELEPWPPNHPALMRFKARRCATLREVREWVRDEIAEARKEAQDHQEQSHPPEQRHGQEHGLPRTITDPTPPPTTPSPQPADGIPSVPVRVPSVSVRGARRNAHSPAPSPAHSPTPAALPSPRRACRQCRPLLAECVLSPPGSPTIFSGRNLRKRGRIHRTPLSRQTTAPEESKTEPETDAKSEPNLESKPPARPAETRPVTLKPAPDH